MLLLNKIYEICLYKKHIWIKFVKQNLDKRKIADHRSFLLEIERCQGGESVFRIFKWLAYDYFVFLSFFLLIWKDDLFVLQNDVKSTLNLELIITYLRYF